MSTTTAKDNIEWRIFAKSKDGKWLTVAPYITPRAVMAALDNKFGNMNWNDTYVFTDKGVMCTITVYDGTTDCYKSDAAAFDNSDNEDMDQMKTVVSEAFKRAAVKFDIGRDLYEYPKIMIDVLNEEDKKKIPDWAVTLLGGVIDEFAAGTRKEIVFLKKNTETPKPKKSLKEFTSTIKANMIVAINEGKWKDVEKALGNYEIDAPELTFLKTMIENKRATVPTDAVK